MSVWKKFLKRLGLYKETIKPISIYDKNQDSLIKTSLCIGINKYPNPANNLKGCINDAHDWSNLLKEQYNFDDTMFLLDSDATLRNVKKTMSHMVSKKPDVLVVTFSGHGTRWPHNLGYWEAWCLHDNHLMDYDFQKILKKADLKTKIVVISDSCHAAGVTRKFLQTMNDTAYHSVPRYMPPDDDMDAIRVASMPMTKAIFNPVAKMKEILLAASQSTEYAYDAWFDGKFNGAFSYYAIKILKKHPDMTYKNFIDDIKAYLPSKLYPQTPVLEADKAKKNMAIFSPII